MKSWVWPVLSASASKFADALHALLRVLRQVADKGKVLAVQAAGGQRQQQRHRSHQRHHPDAEFMRGAHHRRAGVGHGGHAGLADQSHVVSVKRGLQQRAGVKVAVVVAFFVHFARQFHQRLRLDGLAQRGDLVDALEVGARRLGVFAHPVRQAGGHGAWCPWAWCACKSALWCAAKVERCGHQVEQAWVGGLGCMVITP